MLLAILVSPIGWTVEAYFMVTSEWHKRSIFSSFFRLQGFTFHRKRWCHKTTNIVVDTASRGMSAFYALRHSLTERYWMPSVWRKLADAAWMDMIVCAMQNVHQFERSNCRGASGSRFCAETFNIAQIRPAWQSPPFPVFWEAKFAALRASTWTYPSLRKRVPHSRSYHRQYFENASTKRETVLVHAACVVTIYCWSGSYQEGKSMCCQQVCAPVSSSFGCSGHPHVIPAPWSSISVHPSAELCCIADNARQMLCRQWAIDTHQNGSAADWLRGSALCLTSSLQIYDFLTQHTLHFSCWNFVSIGTGNMQDGCASFMMIRVEEGKGIDSKPP